MSEYERNTPACALQRQPDYSGVDSVTLHPDPPPADYREAMKLATVTAEETLGEHMLLSWYDRDRDFESPQHTSECDQPGAVPGFIDFGVSHGARLVVDIDDGRFVFLFLPLAE